MNHKGYEIPNYSKTRIEFLKIHRPLTKGDFCDSTFDRCGSAYCEICLFRPKDV